MFAEGGKPLLVGLRREGGLTAKQLGCWQGTPHPIHCRCSAASHGGPARTYARPALEHPASHPLRRQHQLSARNHIPQLKGGWLHSKGRQGPILSGFRSEPGRRRIKHAGWRLAASWHACFARSGNWRAIRRPYSISLQPHTPPEVAHQPDIPLRDGRWKTAGECGRGWTSREAAPPPKATCRPAPWPAESAGFRLQRTHGAGR